MPTATTADPSLCLLAKDTTRPLLLGRLRHQEAQTRHHDPMSADYLRVVERLEDRVALVAKHFPNVLTIAGVRGVYDWTVRLDEDLPGGVLIYAPGRLTIAVRDAGELEALLAYANEAALARTALRRTVVDVALRAGLTDLRALARPAGATR